VDVALAARVMAVSFEDFYGAEYPKVYRAALAFSSNREVASDATQEAFARAYARWRRLNNETWAGGWVMTTALNLCRKALKHHRSSSSIKSAPVEASPWERVDLVRTLRELPGRQREAVVLFYLGDFSLAIVAQLMGCSEGAVKSHLSRARSALKDRLEVSH
jgi:RNA polymerase sigma-70 factor (ECF subfamily)